MEVPNIIAEEGLNVGALDVPLFKAILDLAEPTIQTQSGSLPRNSAYTDYAFHFS